MIANDKTGQIPAEFDNEIDNIFKVVCAMNVHKGFFFFLAAYDQTKLKPIKGRPFLVSPCVIPCLKIIPIKHTVHVEDGNVSGFNRFLEKNIKTYW